MTDQIDIQGFRDLMARLDGDIVMVSKTELTTLLDRISSLEGALRLQDQMLGNVLFNHEQQPASAERLIASVKTMKERARQALSDTQS